MSTNREGTTKTPRQTRKSVRAGNAGPYVAAALICERVLQEKDGTLTAVRIVDQINVEVPPPQPNMVAVIAPISLALLVSIREAEAREYELSITVRTPKGEATKLSPPMRMVASGAVVGANFIGHLTFSPQGEGMLHFDIDLDGL